MEIFLSILTEQRIPLPKGMQCGNKTNVPCSECSKYLNGRGKRTNEDKKCVWIPHLKGCKQKWVAEKKELGYIENCTGIL